VPVTILRRLSGFATLAGLLLSACEPASPRPPPGEPHATVEVQILAFNDFHGNVEPPSGTNGFVSTSTGVSIPAGGAAYLAAHIRRLRAHQPRTVVVSAGDLTGASPLVSSLFEDRPAIDVMNAIGLAYEGIGNHDFDRGLDRLARLRKEAKFEYLGANVVVRETGQPLLPSVAVRELAGVRIAFVGATLRETPSVTTPGSVDALAFEDEASSVNALVPRLRSEGVSAIVLLLHEGGKQKGAYDGCDGLYGDVLPILEGDPARGRPPLDAGVDVVVSGHTHAAYVCTVADRLVTSALSYGRLVTQIELAIDPAARRVVRKQAHNVVVTRDVEPDAEVARLVAAYHEKASPTAARVVGWARADVAADARKARSAACESPLGDLVADAQLAATRDAAHGGAELVFVNPGAIRADLVPSGTDGGMAVTYAAAFAAQPFGNTLVTMTLTGAQIREVLDAQFARREPIVLQVSDGFSYRYAYDRESHHGGVDARSVRLSGRLLDDAKRYRVTVNSFLAAGGDGFAVFRGGADRKNGPRDVEALVDYLGSTTSAGRPLDTSARNERIEGDLCR
jgi:5'-nucleotidase